MTLVIKRTLLACLAVVGGASIAPDRVAQAQEVTVKVGTVRSISTARNRCRPPSIVGYRR